jgi:hypothetical protein
MQAGYGLQRVLNEGAAQAYFSGHEHVNQYHRAGKLDSFVCGGVSKQGFYGGKHPDIELDWMDASFQPAFVAVTVSVDEMITQFVQVTRNPKHAETAIVCKVVRTVHTPRVVIGV